MRKEIEFCRDEMLDQAIYSELARRERNAEVRELLKQFAEQELRHYEFWKEVAGDCGALDRAKLSYYLWLRRFLGLTFTLKLLERHEKETIEEYKNYLPHLPEEKRAQLLKMIEEEESHERSLIQSLAERENAVKYLGFVALGLADAIVEITGVHAGFLGATATTVVAGVAGLIVGVSAAIAMSGAAYLQAKHGGMEERLNPLVSAGVTGFAYIFAVLLLALPYFLTHSMAAAFLASLAAALLLIVSFTYYGSVVGEREFTRELLENVAILLVTAIITYIFGVFVGEVTGIRAGGLHT
ncbi:MAG: VIT1/CCC1 family protein [Acidilobaceae archaeon]|nr:VIT1/CCC1 family protein [Acidilobaceae archaeon]MCX8165413.1 VIT1/CCC1 family protein [Acidilobaceae archaeon]MDW7973840.1 VIT1/CCC1 family protein [Sulfolobales archaeon]